MKTNKKFLLKQQIGGMLVELMMTLAISVIIIPFVFRYQQNAVERARNIAVARQMETVQDALEKYITRNRNTYINHSGNYTWTNVTLHVLAESGLLPDDFSEDGVSTDFGKYALRVMKTQDIHERAVLQGVVILENSENTPLRTHEIVNMGGGKIGYIEGSNIRGGFNVFLRPKSDMGLSNVSSGLVGTTGTLRGNNEYLWRVPSDSELDATMESQLNLDGQNITDVNNASILKAFFDESLTADIVNVRNVLYFFNTPNFNLQNFTFTSGDGRITNGDLYSAQGSLTIDGTLLTNTAQFNNVTARNLSVNNNMLDLQNVTFKAGGGADADKLSVFKFEKNANNLSANKLNLFTEDATVSVRGIKDVGIITPKLTVGKYIFLPNGNNGVPGTCNEKFCWDITKDRAALNDLVLTTLPSRLEAAQERFRKSPAYPTNSNGDKKFNVFTDKYLSARYSKTAPEDNGFEVMITSRTPITQVLTVNLCAVKVVVGLKYDCAQKCFDDEKGCWNDPVCQAVLNKNYDLYIEKTCKKLPPVPNNDDPTSHNNSNDGNGGGFSGSGGKENDGNSSRKDNDKDKTINQTQTVH